MKFQVPGFPDDITEEIELPNIAELLRMPIITRMEADKLRVHGTEFQNYLLDKAHLSGKAKYVYIDSMVQYLYPGIASIGSRALNETLHQWHLDGLRYTMDEPDTAFHLLQSECSVNTVFNAEPFEIELERNLSFGEFNDLLNKNPFPFNPRPMPHNRFVKHITHIHNSLVPRRRDFRFLFRITESNSLGPHVSERPAIADHSNVFVVKESKVYSIDNIIHSEDCIKTFIKR